MVFHEIDSITDVINRHRIIIYYIKGSLLENTCNETKLHSTLERALEMMEKKNDDLLIIKVECPSKQFHQFQELYKPQVKGAATLFTVNSEGIPIISELINQVKDISNVIESLCTSCQLNQISKIEIAKLSQIESKSDSTTTSSIITNMNSNNVKISDLDLINSPEVVPTILKKADDRPNSVDSDYNIQFQEPFSTELQIRLPNGSRDKQKFNKDAMLQEVWLFIFKKYDLKDFDLKTYNHQNFTEEEYVKTVQDLDLYPNGVIIVVPKNKSIVPFNMNGGISGMVQMLLAKTASVFRYIQGLLIVFWNSIFFGNGREERTEIRAPFNNSPKHSNYQRRSKKSSSTRYGNIHTLRRDNDSDDENNSYNGNSTQQK